jgi:glycosyltransferase involved in cell wall biosynthesis
MLTTTWSRRRDYTVAQVDVFSGASFLWAESVCFLLRRAGKPYVLTLHGGGLPKFMARWPRRARALLGSAAAVTVPSGFLYDQLRRYRSDLLLIPNALDLETYPFRLRASASPRLIWLRAFHRIYNPTLAPKVLKLLAGEFPNVTLTMTGPDKGDGSLQATQELACQLRVESRIQFQGTVPKSEVPQMLSEGDIYLNTTNTDNAPVSVVEAMACGLCVVTTNVGGIPYLVDNGVDALSVNRDAPEAMANAVARILRDPALAQSLSANARRKAEVCDWRTILPRWSRLFHEIAR